MSIVVGFGANKLHRESQRIAEMAKIDAVSQGLNIIEAVVGKDYAKVLKNIEAYRAAGYEVKVQLMDVSSETSLERAFLRFYDTGRFVPTEYILLDVGQNPQLNYLKLLEDGIISKEDWRVINNDGQIGEEYEVSIEELRRTVSERQVSDVAQRRRRFGIDVGSDRSEGQAERVGGSDNSAAVERIRGILRGEIALDIDSDGGYSSQLFQEGVNRGSSGVGGDGSSVSGRSKIQGSIGRMDRVITFTPNADVSTFLHEVGHAYLLRMQDKALSGERRALDDIEVAAKWLGAKDIEDLVFRPGESPDKKVLSDFKCFLIV